MKLKNVVKKIIVPALNEYGFSVTDENPRFFHMGNEALKMSASIEVPPRCPYYLLSEYLDILTQKKAGNKEYKLSGYATLHYTITMPDDSHINLSNHMFEPAMGVSSGLVYHNSQDLEEKVLQIASEMTNIVVPFIVSLSKRFVIWRELNEWQESLQRHSNELAQYAANVLNLSEDRQEGYKEIEAALFLLRGKDESKWRTIFLHNIKTIVGIAAYLGECIAAYAKSTEWEWETTPPIVTSTHTYEETKMLYLCAQYANTHQSNYNLLQIIQDLWNYAPYIKCRHIESIFEGITQNSLT